MTLNARKIKSGGPAPQPVEPGSYPARLVQVIDMGLQPQVYLGEKKDPKNEIMVTYELLDEFMKDEEGNDIDDKPRWISETFSLNSLNVDRAKSTQRYMAFDPELTFDGDWSKLLEVPVIVTLVNKASKKDKDKVYTNVAAVSTMRSKDASRAKALVNDSKFFDLENPNLDTFLTLPEWVQTKIKGNLDFDGSALDKALNNHSGGSKKEAKKPAPQETEDDADVEENW